MKLPHLILGAALFSAPLAFAGPATQVPNDQVRNIAAAVIAAIPNHGKCVTTLNGRTAAENSVFTIRNMAEVVSYAQSISIDSSLGMPSLKIVVDVAPDFYGSVTRNLVNVMTSADEKTVAGIVWTQETEATVTKKVNVGDIVHPNFQDQTSTQVVATRNSSCMF